MKRMPEKRVILNEFEWISLILRHKDWSHYNG